MDLSIFFAGTAGSVPTARRGLPALLLRAGGDRLLADAPLHDRLAALSARLAVTPGTATAADLIERLAADAPRDHQ